MGTNGKILVEHCCHQPGERVVAAGRAGKCEWARMAGEVLWSLALCKLGAARGVGYTHPWPKAGATLVLIQVQASGWEQQQGFPSAGPGLGGHPSGIMYHWYLCSKKETKEKLEKGGTSLLSVLKTQGTWYPQGGKVLCWSGNRFQKTRLEVRKEAGSFWVFI